MENTKYSSGDLMTKGEWLETHGSLHFSSVLTIDADYRRLESEHVTSTYFLGVRPVIEVAKTDIDY